MQMTIERRDRAGVGSVTGEMTIYSAVELKTRCGELLAATADLELNLAGVDEFDSAGVQLLLWLKREAEHRNGRLRIVERSRPVGELMELYGLQNTFD